MDRCAGVRRVGVSARCWVLREQAPLRRIAFLFSRVGVGGCVRGWGLLSRWRWECRSRIGPCWWRVSAWRWVLRWPWGVCELDSGCEHLDLIDLLMSDLNSLFWSGFCCSALIPNVVLFGCVSELGRTVDALVPGADEGRGGPR